jgi:hypothetical protein
MTRINGVLLAALVLVPGCRTASDSSLESVGIAQTAVRDQFQIGFCWAYGAIALIESDHKVRTGEELSLSAEALGFYQIAHQMQGIANLATSTTDARLLDEKQPREGATFVDPKTPWDTVRLLKQHGVVPESVWSTKFKSAARVSKMKEVLREALVRRVGQKRKLGGSLPDHVSLDEVMEMMVSSGAFASRPPETFETAGGTITARDYLTRELGFNLEGWDTIETIRPDDYRKLIAGTKRALLRGLSVPFEFPVDHDHLSGTTFRADAADWAQFREFSIFRTHIVTITDFVNNGGKAGAIPLEALRTEFAKSPDELDYLILKNSWGSAPPDDRYEMTLGYLKFIANGVIRDTHRYYLGMQPENRGSLKVFVPRDIAADPFGDEPVNPKVVAP